MKNTIDLKKLFKESLCSFETAKRAKEAGMTCANTFFSYNEMGDITDGAWLEKITGSTQYPAINLPLAIAMLEDTTMDTKKCDLYEEDGWYYFGCGNTLFKNANIVDLIVDLWINFKTN